MPTSAFRPLIASFAFALFLAACKKGEITRYRVPKEKEPAVASAAPAPSHREADWTVPPGWREQPASGMRAGSFLAKSSNGQDVDISVVPLAGDAGGELANVNRWRGQIAMAPVDEAQLKSIVKTRRVGPHNARIVEFGDNKKRILAAILVKGRTSWFIKASGDDAAVKEIHPSFMAFVESVRFHDHE